LFNDGSNKSNMQFRTKAVTNCITI